MSSLRADGLRSAASSTPLNTTDADGSAWHFADEILAAIDRVKPVRPQPHPDTLVTPLQSEFSCGFFNVTFNTSDGSIVGLVDVSGRQWASPSNAIGQFRYQTFSLDDFNLFNTDYNLPCPAPCGTSVARRVLFLLFLSRVSFVNHFMHPTSALSCRRLLQGGDGLGRPRACNMDPNGHQYVRSSQQQWLPDCL